MLIVEVYESEARKHVNLPYLHVVSSMQSLPPPDSKLTWQEVSALHSSDPRCDELVLQKVASEGYPKVRNHGEGPY